MNNMVARTSFVNMRNFPVLPVKVSEGILTRADTFSPNGGLIKGMVSYAAPVLKGDLVQLVVGSTDKGVIKVQKLDSAGAEGIQAAGMIVESPKGIDSTTVSGQTPAVANERIASVAFFGLGVIELVAAATIVPGASLDFDDTNDAQVDTKTAGGNTTLADNGGMCALTYATVGEKVAVLMNAFFAVVE